MPVKRRPSKRRVSAEREYFVWCAIFDSGNDFFQELGSIGVEADPYREVPIEPARVAWARFGPRWLSEREHEERLHPIWALEQFGRPWEAQS